MMTTESPSSSAFLKRLETGEHRGYTSPIVLSEVTHRLLVFTAIQRHHLEPKNAVRFLKAHPDHVKALSAELEAVSEIRDMGISVPAIEPEDIFLSLAHQQRYGLMNNDSANLQIMLRNGIFSMATNDSDFERVDAITAPFTPPLTYPYGGFTRAWNMRRPRSQEIDAVIAPDYHG